MLENFLNFLQEQVDNHSIYVWGAQGQDHSVISENWIEQMETSSTNAQKAISFWKKQVSAGYGEKLHAYDCSGLGMYYLYNLQKLLSSDMTANTMKSQCKVISKSDLKKGDWVFRCYSSGKAYHIGYIVDEALNVIEAKGRTDGVVKRSLNASGTGYWNVFGRPNIFAEEIDPKGALSIDMDTLRKGSRGEQVKTVQRLLDALGYDIGASKIDGDYGSGTESAVESFQKKTGISVDGICGQNTWEKLLKKPVENKGTGGKCMIELSELRKGSKGEEVKTIQRLLKSMGYSIGNAGIDGDFGSGTENAVKSFQKKTGISVDGICGQNTWEKLLK